MNKEYKLNKELLDLLIEHKNNDNVTFKLSNNDIRILLTYIEILQKENKKYKEVIDDAIQFIKDTCIEQVPDMPKGCYREIASIGDLLDLLDILKEVEETDTNVGEVE